MLDVDSIELDDDQSDAESTDSVPDAFANIPLPSATVNTTAEGTPVASGSKPTLDAIPLPKSPLCDKQTTDSQGVKADTVSKVDESVPGVRSGDAVHAKTSIGPITVLLNRKLGPRLTRASVFDMPDDNTKEVNRKLLKLRRLKRMKKNKDGQTELETGTTSSRKALQERISEWKEELLKDQNFKSKRSDAKGMINAATGWGLVVDAKDNQLVAADEGHKTEAKDQITVPTVSGMKTEVVDAERLQSLKSDDSYRIKLYDSFIKVTSGNDAMQLDWPREMVQETRLAPKLVYSCNPLYFNFRKLHSGMQQNVDSKVESKKHKHQKKRKKNETEKTEDRTASSTAGHKDTDSLDLNKEKTESCKKPKKYAANKSETSKEHTQKAKNSSDQGVHGKKTKRSAAHIDETTKPNSAVHLAQSKKRTVSGAKGMSLKLASGSQSHSSQPTIADDEAARTSGKPKETGKSRWDTSSESEAEVKERSTDDRKTSQVTKNRLSTVSDQSCAKTTQHHSPEDCSRSRGSHWSSGSSARSHRRSRYRSSSSASNYSCSSSLYYSSSCSYRRRHRLTNDSTRSCSYTSTASDYSRSSRSYSRSRSTSRRRPWRSRSYSRSRSSSLSCSPHHRNSSSRLRPQRNRSSWQSQVTAKLPRVEPHSKQQAKTAVQQPKTSSSKVKTDKTKDSLNSIKPAAAPEEPSDSGGNSTELRESKPVTAEESKEAGTDSAVEDVKSIPTPEEHMESIPLPVLENPKVANKLSFIGPVLPSNHPLAHKQDIPLPPTAKFQCIGPNDPLVFRSMPPPPPPPASLTGHSQGPGPPSPPADDMEDDIAGDEDPIPQMLDVGTLKPATFIPPEQDEMYGALRRQAELHARRQRIREETGMDIDDEEEDEEEESAEAVLEDQLGDQAYLDEAGTILSTPVIHVPQQHLVGQPLGPSIVPIQMIPAAGSSLVGLEPSLVPLLQHSQTPTVLAMSPAALALARAQEEAEAEAQLRQQVAAAQVVAAQRQRAAELVQLLPGHIAAGSPALAALRPAGLPLQAVPVHAIAGQQPQQQLIQLPTGRIVGVRNVIPSGVQVIAQPQAQPAPLVIGPNGTILRLIR